MPPHIPQYHELMWPALTALKELGGSAKVKEMYEQVVDDQHFSEEQQEVSTKDGRMSEIEYRLHWARTHLKGIGAINNSTRGVWTITDKGKTITPEQVATDTKEWRAQFQKGKGKGAVLKTEKNPKVRTPRRGRTCSLLTSWNFLRTASSDWPSASFEKLGSATLPSRVRAGTVASTE